MVKFVKDEAGEAHYDQDVIEKIQQAVDDKADKGAKGGTADAPADGEDGDELLPAAVEVVLETGQASVSMLQRRLKLGYSRAARLVDQMEERGYRGPLRGQQAPAAAHHPREVAGAANGQGRISGGAGQARRPLRQHQRRIRKPRRIRISISKALRSEGFTVTPCR